MIALAAAISAGAVMMLALVRLFGGQTLYDRALAARSALVRAVLVCAAIAVAAGRSDWLDAAIALGFAALVLMVAVVKVFRVRTFQAPMAREEA